MLMICALGQVHLQNEMIKLDVSQGFCNAVCNHLISLNIWEFDFLETPFVMDIVVLDINMFNFEVEAWIVGQSY